MLTNIENIQELLAEFEYRLHKSADEIIADILSEFPNKIASNSIANPSETNDVSEAKMLKIVSHYMVQLGIPAHLKGYNYLREAIIMCIEDVSLVDAITKELYPRIAEKFNTNSGRVERAIRHAIELAWTRGDINFQEEIFQSTISSLRGKPTNSEFIALVSDTIRLELL